MSKIKAVGHYALAAVKGAGILGTVTGTGAIHIVAGILKVRIPGPILRTAAKYQADSLKKSMEKAAEEWDKE